MAKLILGMGTGRCGTRSLAELLNQQPETEVTHEQPPLFPWIPRSDQSIVARLERFERRNSGGFTGDVASFYLPYVDQIVSARPDVRIVCLSFSGMADSFKVTEESPSLTYLYQRCLIQNPQGH